MNARSFASMTRLFVATLVALPFVLLTGCGPNVSGTYVGVPGNSVFDKVDLQPGGKVVVTLIGIAHQATYEVKGSSVFVNNGGQVHELKIDASGCLVDGIGGTYCKDGKASVAGGKPAAPASGMFASLAGGGVSGTYEAKGPDGAAMTITFVNATQFKLGVNLPGMNNVVQGTYQAQGDHLLLRVDQDTQVLDLTRQGNTLEGQIDGDVLKFVKQ